MAIQCTVYPCDHFLGEKVYQVLYFLNCEHKEQNKWKLRLVNISNFGKGGSASVIEFEIEEGTVLRFSKEIGYHEPIGGKLIKYKFIPIQHVKILEIAQDKLVYEVVLKEDADF